VRLRGPAGQLRARVYWPAPAGRAAAAPALLVFLGDDATGRRLCVTAGLVVLAADLTAAPPAIAVVSWAADHAAELEADPGRLLVGGEGAGGALAAEVARHARDQGWPPIIRQVLVHPEFARTPPARSLPGVAPATLLGGGGGPDRYAARLRDSGVEVEELQVGDPQRGLTELAAALRDVLSPFRSGPIPGISPDPAVDFGQPDSTST
jgi:dienelactone hydrolase